MVFLTCQVSPIQSEFDIIIEFLLLVNTLLPNTSIMRIFTLLFFGYFLTNSALAQDWVSVDINPNGDSNPEGFYQWGSEMFFVADDGSGRKAFKTDGTVAGTIPLTGPNFDMGYVFNFAFKEYNGELYFTGDDGVNGRELWKTDGTVAGTQMVADVNPTGASDPTGLCVAGGKLFFGWQSLPEGLWMTDGTEVGTVQVQDPNSPDFIEYANSDMVELNGSLIFFGQNSAYGRELMISDGTAPGTMLLKNIYPGVFSSYPSGLVKSSDLNEVFFQATNGTNGYELWKTDGTEQGTVLVHDINPGSGNSNPGNIVPFVFQQQTVTPGVFFTADAPTVGNEIFFTDGVQENPTLAVDMNIGLTSSDVQNLIVVGTSLVCRADGPSGIELAVLNELSIEATSPGLTEITTSVHIEDINPGIEHSFPGQFIYDPDFGLPHFFFTAETAVLNTELLGAFGFTAWFQFRPEETRAGGGADPYIIAPPTATEADPLYGGSFALFGTDKMVISAAYTNIGRELWIYTPEVVTSVSQNTEDNSFSLVPNPTTGDLTISLITEKSESFKIELFDLTGKQISILNQGVSNGIYRKTVSLPAELSNGIYLINVQTATTAFSRKIVLNR